MAADRLGLEPVEMPEVVQSPFHEEFGRHVAGAFLWPTSTLLCADYWLMLPR